MEGLVAWVVEVEVAAVAAEEWVAWRGRARAPAQERASRVAGEVQVQKVLALR